MHFKTVLADPETCWTHVFVLGPPLTYVGKNRSIVAEQKLQRSVKFALFNYYPLFFIGNTFISNARLKLAKNQANAKQHPEAELLIIENYAHSSYTSSSKNYGTYSKSKITSVCLYSWDYVINHNENEDQNEKRSHRYDMKT